MESKVEKLENYENDDETMNQSEDCANQSLEVS